MDNMRMVLFAALAFVVLSLWQAWQKDYGPQPASVDHQTQGAKEKNKTIERSTEDIPVPVNNEQPKISNEETVEQKKGQRIEVQTDVIRAVIDTNGGDIRGLALKKYPIHLDKPDEPVELFKDAKGKFYASQGGFLSKQATANHHSIYQTTTTEYNLTEGQEKFNVVLSRSEKGMLFEKIFTFRRGQYLVDVAYRVKNNSKENWSGHFYEQLQRKYHQESRKRLPTFTGGAVSSPEKRYEKIKFKNMAEEPVSEEIKDGWVAMIQHYFVSAIIPEGEKTYHYYSKVLEGDRYVLGLYGPQTSVAPGQEQETKIKVYAGPKEQKILKKIAPGLELTTDYGVLWFIAKPIFWLLSMIHSLVGNWGWSIILVTVVIKAIFYPLSAMGYKSMARMRKVTPRMTAIKERYSKDKARMNQAMMELYKTEKINPLGGCFPILIQIPVFLALYWVLLESVEMRQAPFMLWIQNLSVKDPFFILPLIMGVSMFIQQKLNPPPPDPMQAKVMQFLPVIFTVFFAFFPAGLVLYWVTNNILSIFQQWTITKQIEAAK